MAKTKKTQNEYRRTFSGVVQRMYYYMSRRVKGGGLRPNIYLGLSIVDRDTFYKFANSSVTLKRLFKKWERSGYKLTERPTPDRIDRTRGYDLDNIQFLRYSDNCRKVVRTKRKNKARKNDA